MHGPLNNAIDHFGGRTIDVSVRVEAATVELSVADDGVGAFERIRAACGLDDNVQAAAELTKGKVTSVADRHSGEGIFFSLKVAQPSRDLARHAALEPRRSHD